MRLIDADALKTYIDLQKWRPFIGCTVGEAFKIMIDEQPTVSRQAGKWITEPNCYYRCSECGFHQPSIRGYMGYKFCPSCGAKMEGNT